jgi:hypothetical protein
MWRREKEGGGQGGKARLCVGSRRVLASIILFSCAFRQASASAAAADA